MIRYLFSVLLWVLLSAYPLFAEQQRLRIEITEGVIEPIPIAVAPFIAANRNTQDLADNLTELVKADLVNSGLFRIIPESAYVSSHTVFDETVRFADWRTINAQGLVIGFVSVGATGKIRVRFRLFDVFANAPLGTGLRFAGSADSWRRIGHRISDVIYSRITGESGYFDSRVVFVDEQGAKNQRQKRLAIMDYDGANVRYLTDGSALVLSPRLSTANGRVFYTGYQSGFPQIYMRDLSSGNEKRLTEKIKNMTFAPRPSKNGRQIVYSIENRGNTDVYIMGIPNGRPIRLTSSPAIDTAPSFSPDGRNIVFESDRSGRSQLYVMRVSGGGAKRISFGPGRYGTPVWSPRGDLIVFTKQNKGRFHIGVMRVDGSEERLLTASFLDEGPTWSPNGRVIMFSRQSAGVEGKSSLYSVDISGRNLRRVPTPAGASDPAWSGLLK